ncbi:hypothetical protein [Spirillospora sp. CA-294931]|uniref:hypothetical protein n=1 Tax=Spirillospora sp. CA-294931 TaxID=3240042 RepID=UPI003D9037D7
MAWISTRMRRRVETDFPAHTDLVCAALAGLTADVFPDEPRDSPPVERIQLAALRAASADLTRLNSAITLGRTDWRDLLVGAELADGDWRERVDAELSG